MEDDIWTREKVEETIGYAKRKQWCGVQSEQGTAVVERCVTTFGAVQQHSFEEEVDSGESTELRTQRRGKSSRSHTVCNRQKRYSCVLGV